MIFTLEWIGFVSIVILGTLSHFVYDWSGHNKIVAIFCAVNESTWEHMKLAIGPIILWTIIEVPFIGSNSNFILAKMVSLLISIIFIPLFFYIYQALLKKDFFFLDIIDFLAAIGLGQYLSYLILSMDPVSLEINIISLIVIAIILFIYVTRTFHPWNNELFIDPISKKLGIDAHLIIDKKKKKIYK